MGDKRIFMINHFRLEENDNTQMYGTFIKDYKNDYDLPFPSTKLDVSCSTILLVNDVTPDELECIDARSINGK